jgi:acetyl esterase/lipase
MYRLAILATIITTAAFAQTPATNKPTTPPKGYTSIEVLWPHGAPGALGKTDDDIPKLYCYPAPGDGTHTAVIVLPGGGYTSLVTDGEGSQEAHWLNDHGISAYVLTYRLGPRYLYPAAMLDGLEAVRFVRAHATAWHVRPDAIGVWGFSAGGHLAGYLATIEPQWEPSNPLDRKDTIVDKITPRPNFAIISYGRLVLNASVPGSFTMETLLGKNPPQSLIDSVNPIAHVTKNTAPSMIYATEFDQKVDSTNATLFFNALQKAGVNSELHIFQRGPHGTHMGQDKPDLPELKVFALLLENWLKVGGWLQ